MFEDSRGLPSIDLRGLAPATVSTRLGGLLETSLRCPQYVLQYLGCYTHRVAISNHRLVSFVDGQVTFL